MADDHTCLRFRVLTGTATVGNGRTEGSCLIVQPSTGGHITAPKTGTAWGSIEGAEATYYAPTGYSTCPLKCP